MTRRLALLMIAVALTGGCVSLRSLSVPIHHVVDALDSDPGNRTLLVMLPGLLDYAEDFEKYGFNRIVRHSRLPIDIVAVDANLRYYQQGSIVERIDTDIIEPARRAGYQRVWVAGISLGGLGAMLMASRDPRLNGIIAIAPFLGREQALNQIRQAGGHQHWQPDENSRLLAWERDLHLWIKKSLPVGAKTRSNPGPRFILATGRQDRYAREQAELAARLAPEQVISIDGTHDWPTWQDLWQRIIDQHGALIAGYPAAPFAPPAREPETRR